MAVALVTGGSSGIGRACALALAQAGYTVAVQYHRNQAEADAVVTTNGSGLAVQADVSDAAQVAALFSTVQQTLGPVSLLVNAAGVTIAKPLLENTQADLAHSFGVNTFGPYWCTQHAVRHMQGLGSGTIINVSSAITTLGGGTGMALYAASKGALETMTKALARELAAQNIRVNAIAPGVIDTPMHDGITEDRRTHLQNTLPMGRMGTAAEVAATVVWLASDAASYVSGAVLPVTGAR